MCSLINLNSDNQKCLEVSNQIYNYFNEKNIDVLFDNTKSIGSKLAQRI